MEPEWQANLFKSPGLSSVFWQILDGLSSSSYVLLLFLLFLFDSFAHQR